MELSKIRRARRQRDRARRRRAMTLGILTGATLLALTAGIFGIVFESRSVAVESSRLNSFGEVVRATTVARAQVGFALALDGVSSELDAGTAATAALDDADASFSALENTVSVIEGRSDDLEASDSEALAAYVATGRALSSAVRSDTPIAPELIADFEASYEDARQVAVSRRSDALDELRAADSALSKLGGLVTFMVAFVVPSVTIAIFKTLSRPPKELLEAEAVMVRDGVRATLNHDLLLRQLEELRAQIAEPSRADRPEVDPAKRIEQIEHTFRSLDDSQLVDFEAVNLGELLSAVASAANANLDDLRVSTDVENPIETWSSPDLLHLLVTSIIKDCHGRSASEVSIEASVDPNGAMIRIVHDGLLRSPVELSLVSEQRTIRDRLSLLGGSNLGLLTAHHLASDLQGTVTVHSEAGRQVMAVRLPAVPQLVGARG